MRCHRPSTVLQCYFDNELDALGAAEFERHLEQCSACISALEALESLRTSLSIAQLYEKAAAPFREQVLARIRPALPVVIFSARATRKWLAVAAAAVLLISYTGWRVIPVRRGVNYETVFVAEIVDAHMRSLQPGHLTDVLSTDQHTVKPWFNGKLDFSPPVQDFTDQGFPLQGGRIDVIHGRSVAVLVYARRKHFMNVFIWPADEKDAAPRSGSHQGYQWIDWSKGGTEFCAVSDDAPSALEQLQKLFTE